MLLIGQYMCIGDNPPVLWHYKPWTTGNRDALVENGSLEGNIGEYSLMYEFIQISLLRDF